MSSEIFQKRPLDILVGLKGVVCIADDVIIHGGDTVEHDSNLENVFKCCKDSGKTKTKLCCRMIP